jgi:hypothetical protein
MCDYCDQSSTRATSRLPAPVGRYAHATSPGIRAGGTRIFKHFKDTVTYDERLHHADVTVRFRKVRAARCSTYPVRVLARGPAPWL